MISARSLTRFVRLSLVLFAVAVCVTPALAAVTESIGTGAPSADLVARAQARLQHDGYLKPGMYSVGSLDSATTTALERFQADHFIPATGTLDADSVALLTTHARIGGGLPSGMAQSESIASRQRSVPQEEETVALASRATVQQGSGRTMPETGGSWLPAIAAGAVLLAAGIALLLRRV